MELYQAYTDYHGMMELNRESSTVMWHRRLCGVHYQLPYGEHVIDLSKPFERITMVDAVKKYAGVDFNESQRPMKKQEQLQDEHHIEFEERHKKGDILNLFFEEYCRRASDPAYLCYGSSDRDFSVN